MTSVGRALVVVGMVLAQLAAVAQAGAQQGWDAAPWSLSAPVATGGAIYAPKIDVDASGNATAVWTEAASPLSQAVRTARFSADTRQWSAPRTLATSRFTSVVDVAVDETGNALALWTENAISTAVFLRASRYDAAAAEWGAVSLTNDMIRDNASLSMNRDGDAVVCWTGPIPGPSCRRYLSSTASWSAVETLGATASLIYVAIDGSRNAVAVWSVGTTAVQTSRFDAVAGTWSAVADLATGLSAPGNPGPRVAMNDAGDAVATWHQAAVLSAARLPAGSTTWSPAAVLASDGLYNEAARPVVAPDGAVTVAWTSTAGTTRRIRVARAEAAGTWSAAADLPGQGPAAQGPVSIAADGGGNVHVVWSQSLVSPQLRLLASRYAVSTGQWTTVTNLSALNQAAWNSDVAVDSAGNVMAVWFQAAGGFSAPQALRWDATPGAPVITDVTPSSGAIDVAFAVPPMTDPALSPNGLAYSLDGGQSWHVPNLPTSPLRIAGLADGVRYSMVFRLSNSAGYGLPSAPLGVRSGTATAPTDFRVVATAGNRVTFAWVAPAAGAEPTGYYLRGRLRAIPMGEFYTGGPATQFTATVPAGQYTASVRAVFGSQRSPESNEANLAVGNAIGVVAAEDLLSSVNGHTVALSWRQRTEGRPVTAMSVELTAPFAAALTVPVGESVVFGGVPPGIYTLRLRSFAGGGDTVTSAATTVTVTGACSEVPQAPRAFSASTQGGRVFLDWLPPSTGGAVSSYVVHVTGAITTSLPMTARSLAVPAPPGTYHVSVASVGLCGTSTATAVHTVVVP